MPQILMLTWEYPPHVVGGLSRHVHALARHLVRQGHAVHVLTREAEGVPPESVEDGVHVLRVRPYFQEPPDFRLWVAHLNFALMEQGARLLSGLREPVLLHAHDWLVAHAARGLKSLFQLPLVATIHATEHGRHGGIHDVGQQYINDIEWWLTYEAWRVIACSHAMQREVESLFGLGSDKVVVLPNGIDLPSMQAGTLARAPREAFAAPEERLLFFIGRLVPEKGVAVLLETIPFLLRRHPVRLVVGGIGPHGDELKRRAVELGIADRVHFKGWVDEETVQALYRHADVAVVPSTYEPFGIVALEAMAAGTPLVASDVGGLAEVVRHGENGLKAQPGSVRSLAEQIDRMLLDRQLARRLAAVARREVRRQYGWDRIARSTGALYEQVLAQWRTSDWGSARQDPLIVPHTGPVPDRYTI